MVMPDAGVYTPGTTYTFLTASNVDVLGDFTFSSPHGFDFQVNYLSNSVELVLASSEIYTLGLRGNRKILANYYNENKTFFNPTDYQILSSLRGTSLNAALDATSPARLRLNVYLAQSSVLFLGNAISSYLNQIKNSISLDSCRALKQRSAFWCQGFGNIGKESNFAQNPSASIYGGGPLLGFSF